LRLELNNIIIQEIAAISKLLEALEKQHSCLVKSDAVTLESCVKEIEECNRSIAAIEVKRRELTKGRAMSEVVKELDDADIEDNYIRIKGLLEEVRVQKDSNELLIKQGLGFTNKLLNILNPSRTPKTYNSYGKITR
jgi:flagellar biosynthesis/type III secretory pathway chaperone